MSGGETSHFAPEALMTTDCEKRRLVVWLRVEMTGQPGQRYLIDLEALDLKSLRDFDAELRMVVQRAQLQPWRP
ncbi:MAG: hypothetical protein JXA58_03625 [Dehalococcoidia bacterium]|nr:hypothetical protein [Dehalococcoidia bacterium]